MSLASEYQRQFAWRPWPEILDALPPLERRTVLDLGCGVGDLTAELVARGASVIGIDLNEELLREARSRGLAHAEFRLGDLRALEDPGVEADGVWSSFTVAYLPDLATTLTAWAEHLKPEGWIALTEVDDLFGHEPVGARTRELLQAYAEEGLAAGRYDFHMGSKLKGHLERAGLEVVWEQSFGDRELAFEGPASPEVLEAWRRRLARMTLLREHCGGEMARVEEDFLGCLARADHRSVARVVGCLARKGGA